jgi:hypothetical protein
MIVKLHIGYIYIELCYVQPFYPEMKLIFLPKITHSYILYIYIYIYIYIWGVEPAFGIRRPNWKKKKKIEMAKLKK